MVAKAKGVRDREVTERGLQAAQAGIHVEAGVTEESVETGGGGCLE